MLAFRYDPGAKTTWERTVSFGRSSEANGIFVQGDVYLAGTADNKTKDIVVARLNRPVMKPAPIPNQ